MAERKIYVPKTAAVGVDECPIEFKWNPGLSVTQKQKNIHALHEAAFRQRKISPVLEISSKSLTREGVILSAFNLSFTTSKGRTLTVETAFQGSKVFELGGPFVDLYEKKPKEAKTDERLKKSGKLICFNFFNDRFDLNPPTFFYDWLYVNALNKNEMLRQFVLDYNAFTDIEFNPEKSWNCQAYSVALYVSLVKNGLLDKAIESKELFKEIVKSEYIRKERKLREQRELI